MDTRLDNQVDPERRDEIRRQSEDYTKRKSINFIGVRKDRTGEAKPHIYDIENFTFHIHTIKSIIVILKLKNL